MATRGVFGRKLGTRRLTAAAVAASRKNLPTRSVGRSVKKMSYVHCDQCRRAFDFSRTTACPRCAAQAVATQGPALAPRAPAPTIASLALALAQAIDAASPSELAQAQLALRDATPMVRNDITKGQRAVAEALAVARHQTVGAPAATGWLAALTRSIVIATIEAATLRLVEQVELARSATATRTDNVVDLFPASARLEAAKRWVADLAA